MTPFKAWTGDKPDVTDFCIFGSRAWTHIPSKKRKSLDPQSTPCIFVGYPDDVNGYILIDPSTDQIIIECVFQFEESPFHAPLVQHAETLVLPSVLDIKDDDSTHSNATYSNTGLEDYVHVDEKVVNPNEEVASELQQISKWAHSTLQAAGNLVGDPLDLRRTRSQHVDPSHVFSSSEPVMPMHCYMVQYFNPHTYSEAIGNPLWRETMQEENDSLLENQTWDLVPLPLGRKLVIWKWFYRTKRAADGQVRRCKAILVAKGF
jgi:hypothetical protein